MPPSGCLARFGVNQKRWPNPPKTNAPGRPHGRFDRAAAVSVLPRRTGSGAGIMVIGTARPKSARQRQAVLVQMGAMITLIASTDWAPFFQTALGALIGAGGAIGGVAFGSWLTWQKERQSVAAVLAGEVQGFINVMKWRQNREFLPEDKKFDDRPFPVFEANIGKLGFLPPDLASEVAGFYSYARGVIQYFLILNMGGEILLIKGENLVSELQKEAARTWQEYVQPTQSGMAVSRPPDAPI